MENADQGAGAAIVVAAGPEAGARTGQAKQEEDQQREQTAEPDLLPHAALRSHRPSRGHPRGGTVRRGLGRRRSGVRSSA